MQKGAVPWAVRKRLHHVRLHPKFSWILRGARVEQWGRWMSPTTQRNYSWFWRNPRRRPIQIHRKNQIHRLYLHGRFGLEHINYLFSTFFSLTDNRFIVGRSENRAHEIDVWHEEFQSCHSHVRLRSTPTGAAWLRQRAFLQQFQNQNRLAHFSPPIN